MLYPVQPLPDLFRRGAFITDVAREGVEPLHTVEVGGISAGYASCADDLVPVRRPRRHLDERGYCEDPDAAHSVRVQET